MPMNHHELRLFFVKTLRHAGLSVDLQFCRRDPRLPALIVKHQDCAIEIIGPFGDQLGPQLDLDDIALHSEGQPDLDSSKEKA